MATPSERVIIDRPETMNLLGLLIKDLLAANLRNQANQALTYQLNGDLLIQAGDMRVVLGIGRGRLTIRREDGTMPRAGVRGSLEAFLGVASGQGILKSCLSGKIRPSGNLWFLWRFLPLIRTVRSSGGIL